MYAVAVLVAFVCALTPSSVHAGWRVDRSTAIAEVVWSYPCNGNVRLVWTAKPRPEWAGWSVRDRCEVGLPTDDPWTWERLCTTMLHEYGHLARFRDPSNADPYHSSNPRSVMSADYRAPIIGWTVEVVGGDGMWTRYPLRGDPRCAGRGRPFLELHEVL